MTEQDSKEFAVMMGELSISFRSGISQIDIDVYFKHLQEFTLYQLRKAVDRIIEQEEYFPKVSKIKTLARTFNSAPRERPMPQT